MNKVLFLTFPLVMASASLVYGMEPEPMEVDVDNIANPGRAFDEARMQAGRANAQRQYDDLLPRYQAIVHMHHDGVNDAEVNGLNARIIRALIVDYRMLYQAAAFDVKIQRECLRRMRTLNGLLPN